MSTPDTLRWWAEQFRTRTSEFYTSHVLVADLNYAADEIESLEAENDRLRKLVDYMTPIAWYGASEQERGRMRELGVEVDG